MNTYKKFFFIVCGSFLLLTCYPSEKKELKKKKNSSKKYFDMCFEKRFFFQSLTEKYPNLKKSKLFKRIPKREGDRPERRKKKNKRKRFKFRNKNKYKKISSFAKATKERSEDRYD